MDDDRQITVRVPQRTGKTQQLMKAAAALARAGRPVVFLCATEQTAQSTREAFVREYGEDTAGGIRFEVATRRKETEAMEEESAKYRRAVEATLAVVEARLRAEPTTSEQWAVIYQQLGAARKLAHEAMRRLDEQETRVSRARGGERLCAGDLVLVTESYLQDGTREQRAPYRNRVGRIEQVSAIRPGEGEGERFLNVFFGGNTVILKVKEVKRAPESAKYPGQVLS